MKARRPRANDLDHRLRPNVGMVVQNRRGQVLWARRVGGADEWQFPQGGIRRGERPEDALFRELREEIGLTRDAVEVLACTRGWLRYHTPERFRRKRCARFVGQKQKYFLLRLLADDSAICTSAGDKPEFDGWRWVSYWYPLGQVVDFKRDVYRRALGELAPAVRLD